MKFFNIHTGKKREVAPVDTTPTKTYQDDSVDVNIAEPNYYETFNQVPKTGRRHTMLVLSYQFGTINVTKSICFERDEMINMMQLLSANTKDNITSIAQLTAMVSDPKLKGLAYYQRMQLTRDIEISNNIILTVQDALKKLDDPNVEYPFAEVVFGLREIFLLYYICDVTLMVGENTDIPNPRKELSTICRGKLAVFFDPKMEYKKNL